MKPQSTQAFFQAAGQGLGDWFAEHGKWLAANGGEQLVLLAMREMPEDVRANFVLLSQGFVVNGVSLDSFGVKVALPRALSLAGGA